MRYKARLGRRARWAVPAGAVVAAGAVIAGTAVAGSAGAQTIPQLPARTAAQLLTALQRSKGTGPMSASVTETASLGLPSLPSSDAGALSGTSLLSGTHTFSVWYGGPRRVRVAEPVSLGESDLRVDGQKAWLWNSQTQTATRLIPVAASELQASTGSTQPWSEQGPAGKGHNIGPRTAYGWASYDEPSSGDPSVPSGQNTDYQRTGTSTQASSVISASTGRVIAMSTPTPGQVAKQILAAIGPSTAVSVQRNVMIAGQPAYQLSLAPKSSTSLVGEIQVAIAAHGSYPLRVQVFARGATSPAFSIGYSSLTLGQPAASNFSFTPPRGAKVRTEPIPVPQPSTNKSARKDATGSLYPDSSTSHHARTSSAPRGSLYADQNAGAVAVTGTSPLWGLPAGFTVAGKGWLSVLEMPLADLDSPAPKDSTTYGSASSSVAYSSQVTMTVTSSSSQPAGTPSPLLRSLLSAATPVHGAWGHGRLVRTSLFSVLITSKGTVLIGAVTPAVLESDAATVS